MDFNHPYTPYAIQQQLMERIFTTINENNIGLFSSPTGTVGKIY